MPVNNKYQCTVAKEVVFSGKGLHSGRLVRMSVSPAKANSGIRFQRTDNIGTSPILANASNVIRTDLCTVLGSGINSVGTIEHLMASFYALGIDNASIKLNGPEVPIMDGSSAIFVKTLLDAGIKTLDASKKLYIVKSAFEYKSGDKFVRVEPSNKLIFDCTIDFENSFIGRQSLSLTLNPKEFAKIMSARTFCHQREIDVMRNAGYALGGSLENAVVVAENGVLNQGGLRYKDEFVRHKMLDCIGDLALIGGFLLAKVTTYKSGHSLHSNFLTEILKNKSKHFSIVEPIGLTDEQSVPVFAEQSLMSLHTI